MLCSLRFHSQQSSDPCQLKFCGQHLNVSGMSEHLRLFLALQLGGTTDAEAAAADSRKRQPPLALFCICA